MTLYPSFLTLCNGLLLGQKHATHEGDMQGVAIHTNTQDAKQMTLTLTEAAHEKT